ncbi:hypothetical protein PHYBLDRAFT_179491 [Phycomyces blakesleeanus NRRL 1555(-)]|uniref:Uncharacterized protein n=1 Tax=Phycomyces blakesleeanus (strain ATCC 8743b / DSM 1359 / FGSC 10004 / NBRC 33097 / NRRL 1555) TaxID=763407 RepID=A0A162UV06_PHYB8|nr:hypothetical protein PHYBLDRAFT_179491 [Phycomyces blakesleeanus NRRL 1555(-)]OAD78242.1 hypothetical protein PHYBLDRAFT_179491 [Phycomyces blakesleeanus NRRL 1555(-)]|eukprot:XP_018296282.1 hypothetical protein PHYBLDRAFT_179491 [Phycomyces blakesleeanus NRRL 1555(-)]
MLQLALRDRLTFLTAKLTSQPKPPAMTDTIKSPSDLSAFERTYVSFPEFIDPTPAQESTLIKQQQQQQQQQ